MAELDTLPYDVKESFACECGNWFFVQVVRVGFIVSKYNTSEEKGIERRRRLEINEQDQVFMCTKCRWVYQLMPQDGVQQFVRIYPEPTQLPTIKHV